MSRIVPLVSGRAPAPYTVRGGGFYAACGPQRFNRALYGVPVQGSRFSVFAGDKPEWLLYQSGGAGYVMMGIAYGDRYVPLTDFQHYDLWYGGGKAVNSVSDPVHGSMTIHTLAGADTPCLLLRVEGLSLPADARLCIVYGGIDRAGDARNMDAGYTAQERTLFHPGRCAGNKAEGSEKAIRVIGGDVQALLETDVPCRTMTVQPGAFQSGRLIPAADGDMLGMLLLTPSPEQALIRVELGQETASLQASWDKAVLHADQLASRSSCASSDQALDAAFGCAAPALEGMWLAPHYLHGAWSWRIPLLGWRSRFGPTMMGWGERVKEEARSYFALMYRDGTVIDRQQSGAFDQQYFSHAGMESRIPVAAMDGAGSPDPSYRLARQAADSVFNSDGAIPYGPGKQGIVQYDMQEDFITQVIYQLQAAPDEAFAAEVFPYLKRHLAWQDRCFDPDQDGLYENFANYWASDSMQYAGAGCALATANQYLAYTAAVQLARMLQEDAAPFEKKQAYIRKAFHEHLWLREEGHPAESLDAMGERLLHPQATLPTVVTCITSGILTEEEALRSLDYVRSELEHIPLPDGELVYNSQYAPYRWSVRDVDYADVCHLALCCFLLGRAEDGWRYLRGVIGESCMRSVAPGAFMCVLEGKSIDFSDSTSMFVRAVTEGLMGYRPHCLAGYVELAPAIPPSLPEMTWRIPDMQGEWIRTEDRLRFSFTLAKPVGQLRILLPLHRETVQAVYVNGQKAAAGCLVQREGIPCMVWTMTDAASGEIELQLSGAQIRGKSTRIPPRERTKAESQPLPPFDRWQMLNLDQSLLHRVSDLFSEPYLSPRPKTCSLQVPWSLLPASWCIGADGEALDSPFGFALSDELLRKQTRDNVFAACGIPFRQSGEADQPNVLYVSQWDRFPTAATIPLSAPPGQLALLITGYTNHMQCGVVNARLRFIHPDGSQTCRELTAPADFRSIESGPEHERPEDASCYQKALPRAVIGEFTGGRTGSAYAQVSVFQMEKAVTAIRAEAVANEIVFGILAVSSAGQRNRHAV